MKKTGIQLIEQERDEQLIKHKRSVKDDYHYNSDNQLQLAAQVMLIKDPHMYFNNPPKNWDRGIWNKMLDKPYVERLAIAGALAAAIIDVIQYQED
jgi:hypothetical protein